MSYPDGWHEMSYPARNELSQLVQVDAVHSTDEVTTVYNLRVADHHTYFVAVQFGAGIFGVMVTSKSLSFWFSITAS